VRRISRQARALLPAAATRQHPETVTCCYNKDARKDAGAHLSLLPLLLPAYKMCSFRSAINQSNITATDSEC